MVVAAGGGRAILVYAPYGRDGEVLCEVAGSAHARCLACQSATELAEYARKPFDLILLTEEAVVEDAAGALRAALADQPQWASAPLIVLLADPDNPPCPLKAMMAEDGMFEAVLLQRPAKASALHSAIEVQLRARERQYRIRDHLEELERRNAYQKFLLEELDHRVKNVLANVQSIASLTGQQSQSIDAFNRNFSDRLNAMVRAHDAISATRSGRVPLSAIVEQTLKPYRTKAKDNVIATGPDIDLWPRAVTTLSMTFHELATNAAKYGSLSNGQGTVQVVWDLDETASPATLSIAWCERGGPPVNKPQRQSFGSMMIERVAPAELGGTAALAFDADGLNWHLCFPIPAEHREPAA